MLYIIQTYLYKILMEYWLKIYNIIYAAIAYF